jgi:2-(1,2-epoxy-1,2-dihydrophenyl)acetyl-CoA isomerase
MAFATIFFEMADGVARLTLNRPERLNAFTLAMHDEVAAALDAVETTRPRVLLLTGAGRGFCAGQDLADRAVAPGDEPVDLGESVEKRYAPLIRRLVALPCPTVCAVNGVAAGAGASIALACDIVVAARSARFVMSFAGIGLVPDSGGSWVLPRLVGQARAMGMALLGDPVSAETAAEWGLIWRCVDDEAFGGEVEALVARLAIAPTRGLAETRRLLREAWGRGLSEQLDAERDAMQVLGHSADYAEGVAAFVGKRRPAFRGA